jgi:hypothetical protein
MVCFSQTRDINVGAIILLFFNAEPINGETKLSEIEITKSMRDAN